MTLDNDEIGNILGPCLLSLKSVSEGTWTVAPPSYRFDIEVEADLVEEIARVKGL